MAYVAVFLLFEPVKFKWKYIYKWRIAFARTHKHTFFFICILSLPLCSFFSHFDKYSTNLKCYVCMYVCILHIMCRSYSLFSLFHDFAKVFTTALNSIVLQFTKEIATITQHGLFNHMRIVYIFVKKWKWHLIWVSVLIYKIRVFILVVCSFLFSCKNTSIRMYCFALHRIALNILI